MCVLQNNKIEINNSYQNITIYVNHYDFLCTLASNKKDNAFVFSMVS